MGNLAKIVANSINPSPVLRLEAIQSARKLLSSNKNSHIDRLIQSLIMQILVDCLDNEE